MRWVQHLKEAFGSHEVYFVYNDPDWYRLRLKDAAGYEADLTVKLWPAREGNGRRWQHPSWQSGDYIPEHEPGQWVIPFVIDLEMLSDEEKLPTLVSFIVMANGARVRVASYDERGRWLHRNKPRPEDAIFQHTELVRDMLSRMVSARGYLVYTQAEVPGAQELAELPVRLHGHYEQGPETGDGSLLKISVGDDKQSPILRRWDQNRQTWVRLKPKRVGYDSDGSAVLR
jgi:hypothetical protein